MTHIDRTPAVEPAGERLENRTHPTQRILVVDADSDLLLLYADALAHPGCHVDAAEDGAAAWEALQAKRYDLVIAENHMPKFNGVDLVKKLRRAHIALPVIITTGTTSSHEAVRNPSLKLAATLLKPFALETLLDTVKRVLRAAMLPNELQAMGHGLAAVDPLLKP